MRRRAHGERPLAVRLLTSAMGLAAGIAAFVTARRFDEDRRRRRLQGGAEPRPSVPAPARAAAPLATEPISGPPTPAADPVLEAPAPPVDPVPEAPAPALTPVPDAPARRPWIERAAGVRLLGAVLALGAGVAAGVIAILLVRGVLVMSGS